MNKEQIKELTAMIFAQHSIYSNRSNELQVKFIVNYLSSLKIHYDILSNTIKKCCVIATKPITAADILDNLDDGRPSPEEAWYTINKSVYGNNVLTYEQKYAWDLVRSEYKTNQLGAKLSFMNIYKSKVSDSRIKGIMVKYILSISKFSSESERAMFIEQAINSGKIDVGVGLSFLSLESNKETLKKRICRKTITKGDNSRDHKTLCDRIG